MRDIAGELIDKCTESVVAFHQFVRFWFIIFTIASSSLAVIAAVATVRYIETSRELERAEYTVYMLSVKFENTGDPDNQWPYQTPAERGGVHR